MRHTLWTLLAPVVMSLLIISCESQTSTMPGQSATLEPTPPASFPTLNDEASTDGPSSVTQTPNSAPSQLESGFSYEFIAALATPDSPASAYRLAGWTEAEWLTAIAEAKAFNTEFIENWGSINFAYGHDGLMQHLMMMEREVLLRYPDMPAYSNIAWDLAYRESTSVNYIGQYEVDQLVSLLESELNASIISLETLAIELSQREFKVVDSFESTNLFGEGLFGMVLHIDSYNLRLASDGESAVFIAIGGSEPGNFHVIPLKQFWDWNYHSTKTISISDLNKNGIDDILLLNSYFASGMPGGCGRNLSLYEWQGDYPNGYFENIAANVSDIRMSTDSGECERPWEFADENVTDIPVIKAYHRLYLISPWEACPQFEEWTLYTWNGEAYEWADEGINSIEGSPKCLISWANRAGAFHDQAVAIVENALLDWPSEVNEAWGPASEDYFRFKLGTWYALRGESELAATTLESVRDQPTTPDFDKASELAALYLATYEQGINAACQAIWENVRDDDSISRQDCCSYDPIFIQEVWGFANPLFLYVGDICEEEPDSLEIPDTELPETGSWSTAQQAQTITQIEKELFEEGNLIRAEESLDELLAKNLFDSSGLDLVRAHLIYLLALTHELSGDEETAVTLYWQLWHDYPSSPYALNASRKLERLP